MKIIVIDPIKQLIFDLDVADSFTGGKKACDMPLAAVGIDFPRASLMVDDEGLLKAGNPVFQINPPDVDPNTHQGAFCGAAFIMGHDHEEDKNLDCPYSLMQVAEMVRWTTKVAIG